MRRRVAAIVLASGASCALCLGQAAPRATTMPTTRPVVAKPPEPTVVPLHWEFKVELDPFRSIPVAPSRKGKAQDRLFWYLRYTVTNLSGQDHVFVPEFVLYTGTGQLLRAGTKVPTDVFNQIKTLHNDPMLKAQTSMTRKLLLGQDNAKSGVAIWPDFDAKAGTVDIFLTGLSGETTAIDLPKPLKVVETDWKGNRKTVTKKRLLLAKTLHLRYAIPGEKAARGDVTPRLVKREWVMR